MIFWSKNRPNLRKLFFVKVGHFKGGPHLTEKNNYFKFLKVFYKIIRSNSGNPHSIRENLSLKIHFFFSFRQRKNFSIKDNLREKGDNKRLPSPNDWTRDKSAQS